MVDNELIDIFVQESKEHLDALEPEILAMETASSDSEGVNTIFRGVHSIKGSSGFFGFEQITNLSHVMENVMALVREGDLAPSREMVDVFLECTDTLKVMIDEPQNSGSVEIEHHLVKLNALLEPGGGEAKVEGPKVNDSVDLPEILADFVLDPLLIKNAISHGHLVFVIKLFMNKDIKDQGKTPYDYFKEIETLGEFLDAHFDFSVISGLDDALESELVVSFLFTTVMGSPDMITSVFDVPTEQVEEIDVEVLKEWLGTDPSKVEPKSRSEEVFLEVVDDEESASADAVTSSTSKSDEVEKKVVPTAKAPPPANTNRKKSG